MFVFGGTQHLFANANAPTSTFLGVGGALTAKSIPFYFPLASFCLEGEERKKGRKEEVCARNPAKRDIRRPSLFMPENSDICHFPDPPRRQLDNAASEGRKEGRKGGSVFSPPTRCVAPFFAAPFSALGRHLSRGRTFQANSPLMISHSTESGAYAESGDYSALSTLGGESGLGDVFRAPQAFWNSTFYRPSHAHGAFEFCLGYGRGRDMAP